MVVSMIYCVSWLGCFQSQIKCQPTHIEQRSLSARSPWVWKESMPVLIIVYCIMGTLFKDLKKCPVCFASRYKNNIEYCGDDNQDPTNVNTGKGNVAKNNSATCVEPDDDTLGISEKQSKIPTMVMWYLPVPIALGISSRTQRMLS